jgi:hypothetical protein
MTTVEQREDALRRWRRHALAAKVIAVVWYLSIGVSVGAVCWGLWR